jgi:hypothetical protein
MLEEQIKNHTYGVCSLCCNEDVYIGCVLEPCGHSGMCETCAIKIVCDEKRCPFDRYQVTNYRRVSEFDPVNNHQETKQDKILREQMEMEMTRKAI